MSKIKRPSLKIIKNNDEIIKDNIKKSIMITKKFQRILT